MAWLDGIRAVAGSGFDWSDVAVWSTHDKAYEPAENWYRRHEVMRREREIRAHDRALASNRKANARRQAKLKEEQI
jgi:hypothetical protein